MKNKYSRAFYADRIAHCSRDHRDPFFAVAIPAFTAASWARQKRQKDMSNLRQIGMAMADSSKRQ